MERDRWADPFAPPRTSLRRRWGPAFLIEPIRNNADFYCKALTLSSIV
jgi:hypothetical protein